MNSPSTVLRDISFMAPLYKLYNASSHSVQQMFLRLRPTLTHPFQLIDHPRDHRQPAIPEFRVPGVQAKWFEQFGIMLGAAGGQHRQIALGKTTLRILVHRVERVHEAVAEGISVDVERRMDEVRNVHPEILVARADVDRGAETFALHAEP